MGGSSRRGRERPEGRRLWSTAYGLQPVGAANEANWPGHGALETRSTKPEIRNKSEIRMTETSPNMLNEANRPGRSAGRGGAGGEMRNEQTKPIWLRKSSKCAREDAVSGGFSNKRSQLSPFLGEKRRWGGKTNPIGPGTRPGKSEVRSSKSETNPKLEGPKCAKRRQFGPGSGEPGPWLVASGQWLEKAKTPNEPNRGGPFGDGLNTQHKTGYCRPPGIRAAGPGRVRAWIGGSGRPPWQ